MGTAPPEPGSAQQGQHPTKGSPEDQQWALQMHRVGPQTSILQVAKTKPCSDLFGVSFLLMSMNQDPELKGV